MFIDFVLRADCRAGISSFLFISKNRILVLAFAFLLNNLIYILAGLFSDLDIRPYAYLFSLDTSPTKRLWF